MTTLLHCPELESWRTLFEDAVPADERARLEQHLETCPVCQERLDQCARESAETLVKRERPTDPTTVSVNPALVQVLHRLHAWKRPSAADEPVDLFFLEPTDRPDILGTLGDYEVLEVIGQGGMGIVLRAFEPALRRVVALKILTPALAGSATARRRFTREARAAAAVCDDHIVAVYGVREAGGLPFLAMQYIEGESLQDRLDRAGPLPLTEVISFGRQTAAGLAAAHAGGLIHRDIKPANLLVENGTRLRITDFGLARMVDDVALTQNGVVAGTPEYMSPEQAGGEVVDTRADLFSLGSVLYALCTGSSPFHGTTMAGVLHQISEREPAPLRSRRPDAPAWLEALVARLLAKDPAQRLQTAAEVGQVLEGRHDLLSSPEPERKEENPGRARPSPRRLRLAALTALTTLGLGLLAFGAGGADAEPGELQEVLFHDFRQPPAPPTVSFWGDLEGSKFLKAEPEGMRITLPATYIHPFGGIGYLIEQGFQGDFEVTATVEVLHADSPQIGYGVGVVLVVNKAGTAHDEWASLGRQKRAQSGEVLYSATGQDLPPGYEGHEEPCTDRVGKLRLKRTGTTLSYLWAPGAKGEAFRTIHECDFGLDPIKSVRLTAVTGREPCQVDVRLIDVQIRSGPASPSSKVLLLRKRWKLAAVLLFLALALPLALLLRFSLRRRPARTFPSPGVPVTGEEGVKKPGPADPKAAAPSIAFPCPGCGKNLRARAALTGKPLKCPACGQGVFIPETNPGSLAPRASAGRVSILKNRRVVASVLVLPVVAGVCIWFFWPRRIDYSFLNGTLGNQFVPEVQESGFYQDEFSKAGKPYRWTDGKGRLVIPIDRRKPPKELVVELDILRPAEARTAWVQIVANNRVLIKQQIPLWEWQGGSAGKFPAKSLDLTGIDLGDELVLDILSDTFVPKSDQRTLGVLVNGVKLLHEAPVPQ